MLFQPPCLEPPYHTRPDPSMIRHPPLSSHKNIASQQVSQLKWRLGEGAGEVHRDTPRASLSTLTCSYLNSVSFNQNPSRLLIFLSLENVEAIYELGVDDDGTVRHRQQNTTTPLSHPRCSLWPFSPWYGPGALKRWVSL